MATPTLDEMDARAQRYLSLENRGGEQYLKARNSLAMLVQITGRRA